MNTRILLELDERPPGKRPPSLRFICRAFLPTYGRRRVSAWVDTGAPFSVVPWRMWRDGAHLVSPIRDCPDWSTIRIAGGTVSCELGRIPVMLRDTVPSFSDWLVIPALLARDEKDAARSGGGSAVGGLPLILGVAGLLDTYEVVLNGDGGSYIVVPGA